MKRVAAIAASLCWSMAHGHSTSDAYLTLDVARRGSAAVIEARWDIALRDLHFVLTLDDDGDGAVTWREVKRHQGAIESYAYGRLHASADGKACAIERVTQRISTRADGAYAALRFRIVCKGDPGTVTLDYRLLFDVDPTHRAIVVARNGKATATSLLSPWNAQAQLSRH